MTNSYFVIQGGISKEVVNIVTTCLHSMAHLATNDQWIVARDLLLRLLEDMGQEKILESNFVNNYLGEYCDFGQAAHWVAEDVSSNGMESNHKRIKVQVPSMEHKFGEKGLLSTVGAISARVVKLNTKTFHWKPVEVKEYWLSLPRIANKAAVEYNYATAVFFNHSDRGSVIDKIHLPSFMNKSSNITVYIPTQKLHEQRFDLTRTTLEKSDTDERCHRDVIQDMRVEYKPSATRNLSMQTIPFLKTYEQLLYNQLKCHTVTAKKDEDIFSYLNRHVHWDNILVKKWKDSRRSQDYSESIGKSNSIVLRKSSKKLRDLKYKPDEIDIDKVVDDEYRNTVGSAKKAVKRSNEDNKYSTKCSMYLKKEKLGDFIKVDIINGVIRCNCESFMKLGCCPEKTLFSLLCNKEVPPTDCVGGEGVQWTSNVRDMLIEKFQTRLFEKKQSSNHQDKDLLKYTNITSSFDPQIDIDHNRIGQVHYFDNSSWLQKQKDRILARNSNRKPRVSTSPNDSPTSKSPPIKRSRPNNELISNRYNSHILF